MKKKVCASVFLLITFTCCRHNALMRQKRTLSSTNNTNQLFKVDSVLLFFAAYLNDYIDAKDFKYSVTKEQRCLGFGVVDLTDTLNNSDKNIYFSENHLYIFGPFRRRYEYCNVAIFINHRIKIFKAINCPKIGDQLADVIRYINDSLSDHINKKPLIEKITNYNKFGVRSMSVDDEDLIYDTFECDIK
jgi:hypothetical protein